MKWINGETWKSEKASKSNWHKWFAWFPVVISDCSYDVAGCVFIIYCGCEIIRQITESSSGAQRSGAAPG